MLIRYHKGIFYPDNVTDIIASFSKDEKKERARAVIVPHARFSYIETLLEALLSHISGEYSNVIVLSPLHSGRLLDDKSYSFFEGEENSKENIIYLGARKNESYAEEEAGAEMLVDLLHFALPNTPISIIYGDIKTAKESKELSSFLLKHSSPSTLFIISTNLSPLCTKVEDMTSYKLSALKALETTPFLLDLMNKKEIYLCGGGLVESVNRIIDGKWHFDCEREEDNVVSHCLLWK